MKRCRTLVAFLICSICAGGTAAASPCSYELRQQLSLANHFYQDMAAYEKKSQDGLADASRVNLRHELDLADGELGPCKERQSLLTFYRLQALLQTDRETLSHELTTHVTTTDAVIEAWHRNLQRDYERALGLGLARVYPKDNSTIKQRLAETSLPTRNSEAAGTTPHLLRETKIARTYLVAFKERFPVLTSLVSNVTVKNGDLYYFSVDSKFWASLSEEDQNSTLSSLGQLASMSYEKMNAVRPPSPLELELDAEDGTSLVTVIDGTRLSF